MMINIFCSKGMMMGQLIYIHNIVFKVIMCVCVFYGSVLEEV